MSDLIDSSQYKMDLYRWDVSILIEWSIPSLILYCSTFNAIQSFLSLGKVIQSMKLICVGYKSPLFSHEPNKLVIRLIDCKEPKYFEC